jgi:single-strand DNA-binding protein
MISYNKVLLIGNLTADPQLKYSQNGLAVATFTLAVNSRIQTRDQGIKDEVGFFDIVVFGKQAENCKNYLSRGRVVFVEGRLSMNVWEDQTGQKKRKINVVASRVQFLSPKTTTDIDQNVPSEENVDEIINDINIIDDDVPF